MRARRWQVILWMMGGLLSGCASAEGVHSVAPLDRLLAHFDAVVFADQHDARRDLSRIRKWAGPIRIALYGAEAEAFREIIQHHASTLAALSNLSIAVLAHPNSAANFEIRFVAWDDMTKEAEAFAPRPDWLSIIVEGSACLFVFRRDERYVIVRALVLIATREAFEHKRRCLLEEMTQALGLPNDSDRVQPSVFNSFDKLERLSPADRIFVRTLYDPRLPPGLPRAEALARARRIIAEQTSR